MIDFRVSREEGFPGHHLGENAADGPDINASGVLAAAEEDFGRAVPESDDFVGVCADGDAKGSGQAKVGKFEGAVRVDQEVLLKAYTAPKRHVQVSSVCLQKHSNKKRETSNKQQGKREDLLTGLRSR